MKHTLTLLFLLISFGAANAQFTVKKILKPSDGECNGKIVLEFEESELPATLSVVAQSTGGISTVETKTYTLSNLCADTYTITMTDNHECVTVDEVVLEECEIEATYIITREDCNKYNGYKIELENLPEGTLFFKWSRNNNPLGNETSSITKIWHGNYNVVISDEFNCSQSIDIVIEDTKVLISQIIQPIEDGGGCDGRVIIKSNSPSTEYSIVLKVNFEEVYSTILILYGEDFEVPIDLCYYDDNQLIITDSYGCTTELDIELFYEDCSMLEIVVDELWHASNPNKYDNGYVKVKFTDPNIDPNGYNFKLYKYCNFSEDCQYGQILVESGIGKTEFHGLTTECYQLDWQECTFWTEWHKDYWQDHLSYWVCGYRIDVEKLSDEDCKSFATFMVRQCSNSLGNPGLIEFWKKNINNEGIGKIKFQCSLTILNKKFNNNSISVTGPNGDIFENLDIDTYLTPGMLLHPNWPSEQSPDHCHSMSNRITVKLQVDEPGEYCFTVDGGCGIISQKCVLILNCEDALNFEEGSEYVYPFNRDHSELGPGHENIEKAFISNGLCGLTSETANECVFDENYLDNAPNCSEDKKFFFTYVPFDRDNPCDGGKIALYDLKELNGVKRAFINSEKFVYEAADFAFNWQNEADPTISQNIQSYVYSYLHISINPDSQICPDGNYCLYEASKIFPDFNTSKYILLSMCNESTVDICELYPNAEVCELNPCYNGIEDGNETGVDCGGMCPPCESDPGNNNQCDPPCWPGEECIDGECLKKCDDTNPCPSGSTCNENGNCIESEGPCNDGDCPDGQICIDGYCYVDDDPIDDDGCIIDCVDVEGQCVDQECVAELCSYGFYYEVDQTDDPIELAFYLNHELSAGTTIEIYDITKAAGLSLSLLQGSNQLFNYGCSPDQPTNLIFDIAESNIPIKVIVEPYNLNDPDFCSANAKHKIGFKIDCNPNKPGSDLSNVNDQSSKDFKIYPNPFKNNVKIESKYDNNIVGISVLNTSGQLVMRYKDVDKGSFDLDTKDLLPGIYFLHITSKSTSQSARILKVD